MHRRTWRLPAPFLSAVALTLLLQGCDSGDGITTVEGSSTVTLSLNGLEPIAGGLNYQAWVVHQSGSNTFGFPLVLFNIDADGRMVDPVADTVLTGPYHADVDAGDALGVTISLELSSQLVEESSFTFILSGELAQGTANMTADDFFALSRDFSNAAGRFTLATPTDDVPDNELNGIWFMDPTSDPTEAGLILPQAPNGWIYEGWVGVNGQSVSTGRFVWTVEADSTAFYSSGVSSDPPLFPGEDFLFNAPQGITFPLDLSGASVFVTIEPWHQWDVYPEDPFFLRILEGQVPADPAPLTLYQMTSLASQFPTGTATIQ
jgi:hypothetical protein